jgi:hypothetical protein
MFFVSGAEEEHKTQKLEGKHETSHAAAAMCRGQRL